MTSPPRAVRDLLDAHERLLDLVDDRREGRAGKAFPDHCLAFCARVTTHHTSEDAVVFPALAAQHPGLTGVLAELSADHAAIAAIVARVEELAADPASLPAAAGELDGLAAVLTSHFAWEERRLAAALGTTDLREQVAWT